MVPPEQLLVWNVKQGWEPLCTFLDKPVPDCPVPRENMKAELIDKYRETDFIQGVIKSTLLNIGLLFSVLLIIVAVLLSPAVGNPLSNEFIEPVYNKVYHLFSTFSL